MTSASVLGRGVLTAAGLKRHPSLSLQPVNGFGSVVLGSKSPHVWFCNTTMQCRCCHTMPGCKHAEPIQAFLKIVDTVIRCGVQTPSICCQVTKDSMMLHHTALMLTDSSNQGTASQTGTFKVIVIVQSSTVVSSLPSSNELPRCLCLSEPCHW